MTPINTSQDLYHTALYILSYIILTITLWGSLFTAKDAKAQID